MSFVIPKVSVDLHKINCFFAFKGLIIPLHFTWRHASLIRFEILFFFTPFTCRI